MNKIKDEAVKINISIKRSMFEKIDRYADELGMNRSAFVSMCCAQYINAQEGIIKVQNMIELMKNLNSKIELTQDDKEQIKQLDSFVKLANESLLKG